MLFRKLVLGLALSLIIGSAIAPAALADDVSVYNGPSSVTATGEPFYPYSDFTCACMPIYPEGAMVQVCREDGYPCVVVRSNDSTPIPPSFDVSWAAGEALGLTNGAGRCQCSVSRVG